VATYAWSPSGRWLALVDDGGGLWLATTDVSAGPTLVAQSVDPTLPPTFAAGDARLAVGMVDDEDRPALGLVEFGIEGP
jgi:hypothetical protein